MLDSGIRTHYDSEVRRSTLSTPFPILYTPFLMQVLRDKSEEIKGNVMLTLESLMKKASEYELPKITYSVSRCSRLLGCDRVSIFSTKTYRQEIQEKMRDTYDWPELEESAYSIMVKLSPYLLELAHDDPNATIKERAALILKTLNGIRMVNSKIAAENESRYQEALKSAGIRKR